MPGHIHVRGEAGQVIRMDLPLHPAIASRLAKGYLRRVNEDGTPWTGDAGETPAPPTSVPAQSAPKAEWVGWAVASGATPDDAEAMTKQDIIEKYGKGATS